MAASEDLIDFGDIDAQKENIQALPSGRSAKALAQIYSPPLFTTNTESTTETQAKARAAFERELLTIQEADDPLDIYDRYIKWTIDTFPSAQATPQSQLLPLLERATKAFQTAAQYKNDSRYLKLWLQYIRLFSDAPREVFIFLVRNSIGDNLALYYEEFAAWSEAAGRWAQAEEIYAMGMTRGARPAERLARKHAEFQQRRLVHSSETNEPSSPALPVARPALATKQDPFSSSSAQAAQHNVAGGTKKNKAGKMQIFADPDTSSQPGSADSSDVWQEIGTVTDRKKENYVAPRPMAGEKLKVGKTNGGVQKMMIFRDTNTHRSTTKYSSYPDYERQCTINPANGKLECVYVNLEAVYPLGSQVEFCFEELRAQRRQWHPRPVAPQRSSQSPACQDKNNEITSPERATSLSRPSKCKGDAVFKIFEDPTSTAIEIEQTTLAQQMQLSLSLADENNENQHPDDVSRQATKKARREERVNRTQKIQVMDVKHISNETRTIQLNMDSPPNSRPKKLRINREQTMTINTKEAMEEIYDIFSQPLATEDDGDRVSEGETDDSDEGTTDVESTGTGKLSAPASEFGDDTRRELFGMKQDIPVADVGDLTGWSEELTQARSTHPSDTRTTLPETEPVLRHSLLHTADELTDYNADVADELNSIQQIPLMDESSTRSSSYVRAGGALHNHRLPFMTPIAELTESSMGTLTVNKQRELHSTKTPSRQLGTGNMSISEHELLSSPFQEITDEILEVKRRVLQPIRTKSTKGTLSLGLGSAQSQHEALSLGSLAGSHEPGAAIISDLQCNPMDPGLRSVILATTTSDEKCLKGLHQHACDGGKTTEIRRWAKAVAKASRASSATDKPASANLSEPVVFFERDGPEYRFKRELGAGTFAPVFLVETSKGHDEQYELDSAAPGALPTSFKAVKMEDPPSIWEWYMINKAHDRLGASRASQSIVCAHEMHTYHDECFLIEQYCEQGTLLDLVNTCRADNPSGTGTDELLAMWCAVELLRTVEALHAKHIIHGDLKGDNIMVRFEEPGVETDWSSTYFPSGSHGWSSKGICLIDFGRGIDMKQFRDDVAFIADWKTTDADCAEMREMRTWTYQIDYHGLAGTLHSLLFGKYMEIVSERGAELGHGSGKTYRIHDSFKRYWQTDIWSVVFDLLLNPLRHAAGEANGRMPLINGMRSCREKMECWLEHNCDRGVGLKGVISKLEGIIREKKRRRRS